MSELHEELFQLCFDRWQGRFAGGDEANNKFDAELIQKRASLRQRVSQAVGAIAARYEPDMIVPIPNGANWLGIDVAWELGVALNTLRKDPVTKVISCPFETMERILSAKRIVLIEDAANKRATSLQVISLPGFRERTVAEAAILDRGVEGNIYDLGIPVEAVETVPIPAMLSCSSPLWKYAK